MIDMLELGSALVAAAGLLAALFRGRRRSSTAYRVLLGLLAALLVVHYEDARQWAGDVDADRIGESVRVLVPVLWLFLFFFLRRDDLLGDVRERWEQLQFFLSRAPVPTAILDETGRYVECSEEWVRLCGVARASLIGRAFDELGGSGPEFLSEAFARARVESGVVSRSEPVSVKWGERVEWVSWKARSWPGRVGAPGGVMILVDVVTDQVEAEQVSRLEENRLAHAQRIALIGELASGVAHDLNNYLQIIASHSEMFSMDPTPDEVRETARSIREATNSATELVRSLLSMGRRGVSDRGQLDLGDLVRTTVELLRRGKPQGLEMAVELEATPTRVNGVRVRLQQLLVNLIVNAQDAMPSGGRIVVSVLVAGERAALRVVDRGVGIPTDLQAKIFERFFTTKPPGRGTGLGLALVRAIVDEHGGTLELLSAVGEGTTFTVWLPLDRSESDQPSGVALRNARERVA